MKVPTKKINLAKQAGYLNRRFPDSTSKIDRSELTWTGRLTPIPLGDTYELKVTYKLRHQPKCFVLTPPLVKRDGKRCPHMYSDDQLCLHWPKAKDWREDMLLVKTVIPWASEWLAHYEIWAATGEWHGRGEHPTPSKRRRRPHAN